MRPLLLMVLSTVVPACNEASVAYQGRVVVGNKTDYRFTSETERADVTPIAGAFVQIWIDGNAGATDFTDDNGYYGPIVRTFSDSSFSDDKTVNVFVVPPQGWWQMYETSLHDGTDPIDASVDLDFTFQPADWGE